jgi:hypothetical protein
VLGLGLGLVRVRVGVRMRHVGSDMVLCLCCVLSCLGLFFHGLICACLLCLVCSRKVRNSNGKDGDHDEGT